MVIRFVLEFLLDDELGESSYYSFFRFFGLLLNGIVGSV